MLRSFRSGLTSSLSVQEAVLPTGRLNIPRVLSLETRKGALRIPHPGCLSREKHIHVLQRALVTFWVQSPDHGDRDDVADAEDVQGLFADGAEHHRAKEGLCMSQFDVR